MNLFKVGRRITMTRFLLVAAATLNAFSALLPGVRADQSAPVPDRQRVVDDLAQQALSKHAVPGMSIAVVDNGRVVYAKGFGTTSLTATRSPDADTRYRLASVTKPFTAVAIFQLVDAGKIKLEDPARQYCPELSALNGTPTIRHLLAHQSGIRHTTNAEDVGIKGPVPRLGAALAKIVTEPLRFPPGTKTMYTSWGYAALGCVIEGASGQSYAEFLKQKLFPAAGLTATTFDDPAYASPTFSPGFRAGLVYGLRPSIVVDTRFKISASGLISSVNDLVRFATAIIDGKLLSEGSVKQMFTVEPGDGPLRFTLGWAPAGRRPDGPAFDFIGSMEGSTAFLDVVPARRYALALLANRERSVAELLPLVREVRGLMLDSAPAAQR
jgi:CubicO group peptidase (beta-lactamase class C family)